MKFCKKCNTHTLRGKSGDCKPCKAAIKKAYRAANQDKIKAASLAYKKANKDKLKSSSSAYYEENKDRIKVKSYAWRESNKDKVRSYHSAYYKENKDKIIVATLVYYKANKVKINSASKSRREVNPDKSRATTKAWKAANTEACRAHDVNRRSLKSAATGKHTASDIKSLLTLQKGQCACCRISIKDGYHVDHIYPLINGGHNDKYNLQLLCQNCNLTKHAKHPIDFMQSRGFLL